MNVFSMCRNYLRNHSLCFDLRSSIHIHNISTVSKIHERTFDIVVIGGGIVGLATATRLKKRLPDCEVAVVEKENYLATHQSGNNGGVIHSGIYYKPGSLKAKLCIEGMQRMYKYCEENNIRHKKNGKLVVATNDQEVKWLNDLFRNGVRNNVPGIELIDSKKIKEIEPYCQGLTAIYSANTGVVDFGEVTKHLALKFKDLKGNILLNFHVIDINEAVEGDGTTKKDVNTYPIRIYSKQKSIRTRFVVTCAGLHADTLAEMTGESPEPRIIPVRGEYFLIANNEKKLVNGSIYQIPNPDLPFHGMHLTSQIDGKIWAGPKSMIASKKEGYQLSQFDVKEMWTMFTYPGLQLFAIKHFAPCFYELMKSVNNTVVLNKLKRYVPTLKASDFIPGLSVGVQAHAMNVKGEFVEEFQFIEQKRILHCRNLPSPAATSSLAIASYITGKVQKQLQL